MSLQDFPIQVGDMIDREGDSRWIESALAFSESGRLSVVLFFSDGAPKPAIAAFAAPERTIGWLSAVDVAVPSTPPSQLEIGRGFYRRERSFPARAIRFGSAPKLADTATVAIYRGPTGEIAVVVIDATNCLIFAGDRVSPEDYEVLGHPSED